MSPTREQKRGEQRERILEAARGLFAARGLDAVTMAEVAAQAGVARATVFNYFPSKHALVEAMTETVFGYFRALIEAVLADEKTSTPTLVRALFSHMGGGIEHYHRFYRGIFREIVRIQVGLDEGGAAHRARGAAIGRLEEFLARGQRRGELRRESSPGDLARAFDSLSNGTVIHWLYDDDASSLRDRMERAAEIFLGPVVSAEADLGEPVPEFEPLPFDPAAGAEPVEPD